MSNVQKMLDATRSANAVDFGKAFHSEMMGRIGDQITFARQNVVANMFGGTVRESDDHMCRCGKMEDYKCKCDKPGEVDESAYDDKVNKMHPVEDTPDLGQEAENYEIPLEQEAAVRGSMQTNRRDPMPVVRESRLDDFMNKSIRRARERDAESGAPPGRPVGGESTKDRNQRERANHRDSHSIGGDSSNYKENYGTKRD